jgi:hypothetical protein
MPGKKEAGRSKVFAFRLSISVFSPSFYYSVLNVDLRKAALLVCLYNVQAGVQSNHLAAYTQFLCAFFRFNSIPRNVAEQNGSRVRSGLKSG